MIGNLHAVGFFRGHIATVISITSVTTTFGGTLALTIMSTVFNNISGISRGSPFQKNYNISGNLSDEAKSALINGVKVKTLQTLLFSIETD